jgi:hypothetical protein
MAFNEIVDENHHIDPSNTPFGERFPSIVLLGDLSIDAWQALPSGIERFSVRTRNGLRRRGVERWHHLLGITEGEFATVPNVGVGAVSDLLRVLVELETQKAEVAPIEPSSLDTEAHHSPVTQLAQQLTAEQIGALLAIRRWGAALGGHPTVGSILIEATAVPEDVHQAIAAILVSTVEPHPDMCSAIRTQAGALLTSLDERQILILRHRWIEPTSKTLEELGGILDLTRERVRQLEVGAFEHITSTIEQTQFSELRWAAWQVARDLGTRSPVDSLITRDIVRSACGLELEEPTFDVIRLINRMRIRDGWFVMGTQADIAAEFSRAAADGFATLEAFDQMLWSLGIEPQFRDEILAIEARLIIRLDHVLRRDLAVQDKAFAILSILDEPRTAEEILEILDEPYNLNGVRNQLGIDDRFVRANRYEWALASWDVVPFTTVADAMADEIAQRGGAASLTEIIPLIVARGAVAAGTVRAYASAPMFVLEGDTVRLRPTEHPLVVEPNLDRARNATMTSTGILHLDITVDHEVLRGSGRPAEWGLTATLGVQPGGSREFTHADGSVRVTWPMTGWQGGTIGSLRQLVRHAGAAEGNKVRITFDLINSSIAATQLPTPDTGA